MKLYREQHSESHCKETKKKITYEAPVSQQEPFVSLTKLWEWKWLVPLMDSWMFHNCTHMGPSHKGDFHERGKLKQSNISGAFLFRTVEKIYARFLLVYRSTSLNSKHYNGSHSLKITHGLCILKCTGNLFTKMHILCTRLVFNLLTLMSWNYSKWKTCPYCNLHKHTHLHIRVIWTMEVCSIHVTSDGSKFYKFRIF